MRRVLLVIPILLFTLAIHCQSVAKPTNAQSSLTSKKAISKTALKIYPNPATHFIQLQEVTGISAVIVYNLVGRKIKQFIAEKGKSYSIKDLPKGMYLIQLLGYDGKVVTTQRMSKK